MVVFASKGMRKKLTALLRSVSETLSVGELDTTSPAPERKNFDITLQSCQSLPSDVSDIVYIVQGNESLPDTIDCRRSVAIVDSADKAAISEIAARHLKALTCGLSGTDTLTLSSLTPDSAVISLQRSITAFDGSETDPFELPVTLNAHIGTFPLLVCAALFCLLGAKNPLSGCACWNPEVKA